ncbi:mannonate dehydratase [Bacillus pumilus]|nr:mannonate dehydratase [Bacillus pumilus]
MNEHAIFGEIGRPGYRLYDRALESYVFARDLGRTHVQTRKGKVAA